MTKDVWRGIPSHVTDACYRCGYDLRTLEDDAACPECGLLARRSRRESDELHDTRPRWLARISRGANLLLIAIAAVMLWPHLWGWLAWRVPWQNFVPAGYHTTVWNLGQTLGLDVAAVLVLVGAWLLASREGYPPADHADRRLRTWLRVAAIVPLVAVLAINLRNSLAPRWYSTPWWPTAEGIVWLLLDLMLAPLPLLLFAVLRGLAKRARSAQLAEHCMIVGVGASASFLLSAVFTFVLQHGEAWGFGPRWSTRSNAALAMQLMLGVTALLFTLWSLYLLVRFAAAFRRAARELRGRWRRDDRAVVVTAG